MICSTAIYTFGDLLANGNAHFIRFHTIPQQLQILQIEIFSKPAANNFNTNTFSRELSLFLC